MGSQRLSFGLLLCFTRRVEHRLFKDKLLTGKRKKIIFYALCGIMASLPLLATGMVGLRGLERPSATAEKAFTLPDLLDPSHTLSYPREGKPHIVNIFASWCASCAVEHPFIMELHEKYNVRMHGVLWQDSREKGSIWLKNKGNPYNSVGLDESGEATKFLLDVTGVPETLVLDGQNRILYRQRGPLTPDIVRDMIAPLLIE